MARHQSAQRAADMPVERVGSLSNVCSQHSVADHKQQPSEAGNASILKTSFKSNRDAIAQKELQRERVEERERATVLAYQLK